MKYELPCAIVRDLLPSYTEGLTEPETSAAVKDHLEGCTDCRKRYNAMTEGETSAVPDTEKEVDYLKTLRKKNRKKVILTAVLAVVLVLAGVGAKLFWIGTPCDGSAVAMSKTLSEDGAKIHLTLEEMNSGSAIRGCKVETVNGVTSITARETLASPFYSDGRISMTVSLDGVHRVDVFGYTIWQDGLMIDYHTNRLLGLKTPYVGNASAVGNLISNLDLDAPTTIELQTAAEPYGVTIHFAEPIAENRRFLVEGNAYVLLALVVNLGEVHWDDPSGYSDSLTLEEANAALPGFAAEYQTANGTAVPHLKSVKDYGTTAYELQLLRNILGV